MTGPHSSLQRLLPLVPRPPLLNIFAIYSLRLAAVVVKASKLCGRVCSAGVDVAPMGPPGAF